MNHRWSGWPGAWCLDCGTEDKRETICVVEHRTPCPACSGTGCGMCYQTGEGPCPRSECKNDPCLEPGSNRHNPYVRSAEPTPPVNREVTG